MTHRRRPLLRALLPSLPAIPAAFAAPALAFPTRPIRIVVPFPPGGTTDMPAADRSGHDGEPRP